MKMTAKFEAEGESFNACFEQLNSDFDAEFSTSGGGQDGKDGATFIPSVSSEGVISWTNDRGLTNPDPVNIKGDKGDKGERGERGERGLQGERGESGKDGYTPIKGVDYFDGIDGKNGIDGKDGVSPVVAVDDIENGHRVTITDKNGAKTFDVMDGKDGAGGGGGANADWSVNDPEADGYVKNRTHWVERPFEPVVWDGNTEGRQFVDISAVYGYPAGSVLVYKISDHVLSKEEIAKSKVIVADSNGNREARLKDVYDMVPSAIWYADYEDAFYDSIDDSYYSTIRGTVICTTVAGDFTSMFGVVIPSVGTYAVQTLGAPHEVSISNDVYHKIDRGFLPNDLGAAIVDITDLSKINGNENVLYRCTTGEFYLQGMAMEYWECNVVDSLPAQGEPAVDSALTTINLYYDVNTSEASGYATKELAESYGVNEGWYPAADLLQAIGISHFRVVYSAKEIGDTGVALYMQHSLYQNVNGKYVALPGIGAFGEGKYAEVFNSYANKADGVCSHAEGNYTTASGKCSHAEGYEVTASGEHSHAEGWWATASGDASHAEGRQTTSSGDQSHAEGDHTTASGVASHAEGDYTTASGYSSHAEGRSTIARSPNQHVQGKFNFEDKDSKYAHIVGNGESNTKRSNAHTIDWNGLGWFAGGLKVGGEGQDDPEAEAILTESQVKALINDAIGVIENGSY